MASDKTNLYKKFMSFSGVDALVFMLLPNTSPICFGSLTTISYSIYRDTKPVPLMNRISVGGYTRGTRFVAGTAIFTLVNKHWTNELLDKVPWLKAYGNLKADELPIFDIMIVCANEYGAWTQMMIHGAWFTDEGQVLSIEDIFTENQFSFVARDINTMTDGSTESNKAITGSGTVNETGPVSVGADTSPNSSGGITEKTPPNSADRILKLTTPMMQGNDVKELQRLLNKHKASPKVTEDSVFGNATRTAVTNFQSRHALSVDGIVGPNTWNALRKDPCTKCGGSGSSTSTGNVSTTRRTLQLRSPMMQGADVREAQSLLNSLSFSTGGVDGKFGPNTQKAVKAFQQSRGLQIDGVVGSTTWDALINRKPAISGGSASKPILRKGSTGDYVKQAQTLLNKKIGAKLTVDGKFGDKTAKSVMTFQRVQGITSDGIIGAITWSKLLS